jgi:hypothetical protein
MDKPHMPLPVLVDDSDQHKLFYFRCDDRAGFLLRIVWAMDGDLHLSIVPDPDHEDHDAKCRYLSGSVRLRLPMIGGGSFEKLMPALIDGIRGEWERYKQATKKEPSHG